MSAEGAGPGWGIPGVQIGEEIGRGSFGRVFKATEPDNGRLVAVKVLQTAALDQRDLRRFERERRAAGALSSHPNIVTVHRSGLDAGGRPYLVMELAAGRSLSDRLGAEGPFPAAEVADIGVKLAGAIETAHRVDVVHCDIKPENVLVSGSGEPLLADFGIAQVARAGSSTLGRAGTFAYSAPEVFRGELPSPASDVFALGATLYALATGFSPFMTDRSSSQESVMYRIVHEDPPDARAYGVPDALATVLERALDKAPERRQASAAELGRELQAVQEALGSSPTRLVVQDIVVPEAIEPVGPVGPAEHATAALPMLGGQGRAAVALDTGPGRRRQWARPLVVAGIIAVVALLATGLALGLGGGGGDGGRALEVDDAAAPKETTTSTASTAAPVLAPLAHRSSPIEFLGTRVERQWTVPAGQAEVIVELTLTNISGTPFRWHHDEALPTSLVAVPTIVRGDPVPEPVQSTPHPILRFWHELTPGQALSIAYAVPRQASWPQALAQADLERWDREQADLLGARRTEILGANKLSGPAALPPTATTAAAPTTAAPVTTPPATTPATQPGTAATAAPTPAPSAQIFGPSTITAGDEAVFSVQSANAVRGTWSETCIQPSQPNWAPSDGYAGTWTTPGNCTLTLTVSNAAGQTASASKSFTVQPFTAKINGPTVIRANEPASWTVSSSGAVRGTWSENCVGASQPNWSPGDGFGGTWTERRDCRLSLTVFSAGGQSFTTSIDFRVV